MTLRLLIALALCGIELASGAARAGPSPLQWWIADSLQKAKPTDGMPQDASKRAKISAARNEFEPFQLILRADAADVGGVDLQCSDLRSTQGGTISASNITIYAEQFMDVTRPSFAAGTPAHWPDALIPRIDRYANERRNAFPLTLRQGQSQPVWIEVYIPENSQPGEYDGIVSISRGTTAEASVPVHLTVWAFTLPSTSSLKSSFGLNGTSLLKQHLGNYTSDSDLYSLTKLYTKAALLHRISTHGGSMVPPKYQYSNGKMRLEWGPYDAEVGPFLNGAASGNGPLQGARETTVELRTPSAFATDEQHTLYLTEWVKHFREKGWADRLFLYLWDEPAPADLPQVLKKGLTSGSVDGIRNLVTVPFKVSLEPAVQIWVPLVNCLDEKPGYDDFCPGSPPPDVYLHQIAAGKSTWFYQSCASHGCNIPGGEYFTGWPAYLIDVPGTANRVMQWIAWKYRMQGELYFSMDEAYAQHDPWTDVRLFGGNGDGTLFYPGRPAKIGGHSDIPIESIRLKLIREGMEDYEYLALLAKLQGQEAADKFANRIVRNTWHWESRTDAFLSVRQELGETLNHLAASPGKQ